MDIINYTWGQFETIKKVMLRRKDGKYYLMSSNKLVHFFSDPVVTDMYGNIVDCRFLPCQYQLENQGYSFMALEPIFYNMVIPNIRVYGELFITGKNHGAYTLESSEKFLKGEVEI